MDTSKREKAFSVNPNPANSTFDITLLNDNLDSAQFNARIIDNLGKTVLNEDNIQGSIKVGQFSPDGSRSILHHESSIKTK